MMTKMQTEAARRARALISDPAAASRAGPQARQFAWTILRTQGAERARRTIHRAEVHPGTGGDAA